MKRFFAILIKLNWVGGVAARGLAGTFSLGDPAPRPPAPPGGVRRGEPGRRQRRPAADPRRLSPRAVQRLLLFSLLKEMDSYMCWLRLIGLFRSRRRA